MNKFTKPQKVMLYITMAVLFIGGSYASYFGFIRFTTCVSNYFSNFFENLPFMLDSYIMTIGLIGILLCITRKNMKSVIIGKNILFIVVASILTFTFLLNVILLTFHYGWGDPLNSSFYQIIYTQMVSEIILLGISIYQFLPIRKKIKKDDFGMNEVQGDKPINIFKIIGVAFIVTFVSTMTSFPLVCHYIYIDGYLDPNWYGVIPTLALCVMPLAVSVLYWIYKTYNLGKTFYERAMLISAIVFFVICLWIFIVYMINPRFIYQSLQSIFVFGMLFNVPLAPIVAIVYVVVCLLVACIKYMKAYKNEKENEKDSPNQN